MTYLGTLAVNERVQAFRVTTDLSINQDFRHYDKFY